MSSNQTTNEMPRHCRGGRWGKLKFLIPFFVAGALLLKGGLVMVLWNALIPELFHGPILTYIQAIGLMLLAKLLVGFGGGGFRRFGHHFGGRGHWMRMSPEEREKMREEFRRRSE